MPRFNSVHCTPTKFLVPVALIAFYSVFENPQSEVEEAQSRSNMILNLATVAVVTYGLLRVCCRV